MIEENKIYIQKKYEEVEAERLSVQFELKASLEESKVMDVKVAPTDK